MRLTKIVCTLGPASKSKNIQRRLIKSGMDVARLNLSHGLFEDHLRNLKQIRELSSGLKKRTAVMFDLPGPKIRLVGPAEPFMLDKGGLLTIFSGRNIKPDEAAVNFSTMGRYIKSGDKIFINDGLIKLKVLEVRGSKIKTEVLVGGEIKKGNGVTVSVADIKLPSVTKRDIELAILCAENGADWLAQSFIKKASDIAKLREALAKAGYHVPIMAKIEKKEAVENIDEIIEAADGVMVARGDLGIQMPPEDVPIIQKQIIALAAMAGKPVVIATQMLESMITSASPTRAEASDVANAIFDKTDAVMLSAETAIGKYPVGTVNVMRRIIEKTENNINYGAALKARGRLVTDETSDAISYASAEIAFELKASLIITATQTGNTALQVSKYRPPKPILALSPEEKTVHKLKMAFGVYPAIIEPSKNIDDMFDKAMESAIKEKMITKGQKAVITAGVIVNVPGTTNLIKVQEA
jgi:pyruvate kinase